MNAIALAELKMLYRNRLVALCAVLLPIMYAGMLIATGDSFGGVGIVAALLMTGIAAMGVYISATTALAARRQNLFLKRLRGTTVSNGKILAGQVLPIVAVNVVQLVVILAVLGIVGSPPENVGALILVGLALEALFVGFALATAGVTNSPEQAQVTTFPLFIVVLAASFWIGLTGTDDLTAVKRLVPGGAATELIIDAWSGIGASEVISLLLPTLAWTFVGFAVASRTFRWDPRR